MHAYMVKQNERDSMVRYRVRFARPSGWVGVLGTAVRGVRLLVEGVGACTWYAIAFVLLDRQAGCV